MDFTLESRTKFLFSSAGVLYVLVRADKFPTFWFGQFVNERIEIEILGLSENTASGGIAALRGTIFGPSGHFSTMLATQHFQQIRVPVCQRNTFERTYTFLC